MPVEPRNLPEQEHSIKAREHEVYAKPLRAVTSSKVKPFVEYLRADSRRASRRYDKDHALDDWSHRGVAFPGCDLARNTTPGSPSARARGYSGRKDRQCGDRGPEALVGSYFTIPGLRIDRVAMSVRASEFGPTPHGSLFKSLREGLAMVRGFRYRIE